ncbi:unnamed protein product [Hermetia illucens]|uniref:Uncharacterized protein n=1 Tax=Hermetia illucens TaxID=343691 RepID=A0A7R8UIC7_HERIL|nr:unnamed protein product [Hermetia illucens]
MVVTSVNLVHGADTIRPVKSEYGERRNIDKSTTKRTIPQGRRSRGRNKKVQQNSGRIDSEMQRANNGRKSSSCLASNSSKHAGPRVTRSTLNAIEDPKVGYGAARPDTQRAGAPNQIRKGDHGRSRKTANINAESCPPSKIYTEACLDSIENTRIQLDEQRDSPDTNTSPHSKRARRRRRDRIRSRRNRKFVCHDCKAASPWLQYETIWTDEFADGRRPRENSPYAAQPMARRYSENKYSEDERVPNLDTDCGDSDLQVVPDIDSVRPKFGGPMEGWALLCDDSDMFSAAADGQPQKRGWHHWY